LHGMRKGGLHNFHHNKEHKSVYLQHKWQ